MMSGTVSLLFLSLCARVLAQAPTPNAQFNQVLNINGDVSTEYTGAANSNTNHDF